MTSTLHLLVLFLSISIGLAVDANCDCYSTMSDTYTNLFTSYTFHDFRHLPLESIPQLSEQLPSTVNNKTGLAGGHLGELQSGFLQTYEWINEWSVQDWGKDKNGDVAPTRMWNSRSNVFVDKNNGGNPNATSMLVLRTKRWNAYQSVAEVENLQKNLMYASVRFRARVVGPKGAVAGLFIYRNDRNESDIEILTRDDQDTIRYSNQPVLDADGNDIPGASSKVKLNTDSTKIKWTDWHTHRLDWTPGKSTWFLDNHQLHSKTYGVPTTPSYLVLNMWSDGGEWSGKMAIGDEARLEIEWAEMVFNTSGSSPTLFWKRASEKEGCKKVCRIDDGWDKPTKKTGAGDRLMPPVLAVGALATLVGLLL